MKGDIRENYETCERIRDYLVACYEGRVKRCLKCDNISIEPNSVCRCGEMDSADEWETVSLLEDEYIYDTEYIIGGDCEYRSVTLMVACGGPNIYINTGNNSVELYWGSDRACAWLPSEVAYEIDNMYRETYETARLGI